MPTHDVKHPDLKGLAPRPIPQIGKNAEDFTEDLVASINDLQRGVSCRKAGADEACKCTAHVLPVHFPESVSSALLEYKRTGGSCLLLEEFFKRAAEAMVLRFPKKKIALAAAFPRQKDPEGDTLRESFYSRQIVVRVLEQSEAAVSKI